jgi:hypothetical protein
MYALRLSIITGRPKLRNAPGSIRDWQASVANSGGLHCTDNVNLLDRELRQRLSDELCRIVTSPQPDIEMRKLYTEVAEVRVPVNCVFAFTAIQMPFHNEDLLQRAFTIRTQNVGRAPESDWVADKLEERGGREAWIAHHLAFLHLFFSHPWDNDFQTQHRLAHLEQCLLIASKILGLEQFLELELQQTAPEEERIPLSPFLKDQPSTRRSPIAGMIKEGQAFQIVENDWVLQCLKAYVEEVLLQPSHPMHAKKDHHNGNRPDRFFVSDIINFALSDERFHGNDMLTEPVRLGRFIQTHQGTLANTLGIYPTKRYSNRATYRIVKPQLQAQLQAQAQQQQPGESTNADTGATKPDV